MKITFLGTGEAFDVVPNVSFVVESKNTKLLVECGPVTPIQLWKYKKEDIDAIYLSHSHADHTFGLPSVLIRMLEEARTKPLMIIGWKGIDKWFKKINEIAFRGLLRYRQFPVKIIEIPGKKIKIKDILLESARSNHPVENNSLKITCNKKILCYSGDGTITAATKKLYKECDFLIHEAQHLDEGFFGHPSLKAVIELQNELKIKKVAIVHLKRNFRTNKKMLAKMKSSKLFFPEEGTIIRL
ncbi:MAG: ribonuclease Z [Candidatus Woesearchaeota archaeon]